ncbi:PilT protein domain protein [Gluconacetobacter diazotrophicus PA1 5]|nr:PilT protein domain protein [Gluconacetobacter diazotrophicus PA1 5]TWB01032.1 tRNA(fMet)-specific endonuclease VapC [Gluconacetobacter diazotrophicus]
MSAGLTMTRMLDTNTVSHILKGHPRALERLSQIPMASVCISVITEAELRFGIAKRPEATRLHRVVNEFLQRVDVQPWESSTADSYGNLRAALEASGKIVGSLDLLIAAHALDLNSILVTNDAGFSKIAQLETEDWTA